MKRLFLMLFLLMVSLTGFATPVDINTADAATIASSLHGIGLKKAQAIVADRDQNGAFKTLEELTRVKGIGAKTLTKNKDNILIGGSVAAPAAPAPAPAAVPAAPAPAVAAPVAPAAVPPAVTKPAK